MPPTHNVRLRFKNLLEVTDWVHTLHSETSYSHYLVIAVMMSLFSKLLLLLLDSPTHRHKFVCPFMAFSILKHNSYCICLLMIKREPSLSLINCFK